MKENLPQEEVLCSRVSLFEKFFTDVYRKYIELLKNALSIFLFTSTLKFFYVMQDILVQLILDYIN